MLRKFKVSNFKNFEKDFMFDLSEANGYEFNSDSIKNGIVNSAIVYGRNGSGKSNLGLAIFDIIEHLTDKWRDERRYRNYLNAYSGKEVAEFYYEFLINGNVVKYEYKKTDYKTLLYERLSVNDVDCVVFDRLKGDQFYVNLAGAETLNTTITDKQLSALKYIRWNTVLLEDNATSRAFIDFFDFVNKMLFFRGLENRMFLGTEDSAGQHILDDIIEKDKVSDLEKFLNDAKIECKLSVVEEFGIKTIAFRFNEKIIPFGDAVSTGTNSLTLFYFWYLRVIESGVSLLFIDEFDAFYHHELSRLVVEKLKETGVQFILTTHNTSIMTNELLRPDCYFIIGRDGIKPLSKCTEKELREAHNLEKIYKSMVSNEN
jgi:energy-coupling factor transporter ATP-binding protein EcfA2